MWTSKRVLFLLTGFALFFTVYQVYANVLGLGGIDGLTPLPVAYWPPTGEHAEVPARDVKPRLNLAKIKLKQAFGEASPEIDRLIMLDMPSKGLVLAVDDIKIMPAPHNDWVLLSPFSLAIMKTSPGNAVPEINSIRCKEAYLQLDQPIKSQAELSKCKIIGGELRHDVQLVNNRGTAHRTDDLEMYTHGRVHYEEKRRLIWTSDPVKLTDYQTRPEPTTVTANGMDVYLTPLPTDQTPAATVKNSKNLKQPDVDRVELRSNVRMDHWVEGGAGFMTTGKPAAKTTPGVPTPPLDRTKLVITTDGKFVYDIKTNKATFDIPRRPSPHPEIVRVVRELESAPGKRDQLECDHLTLQFRRKTEGAAPAPAPPANSNRSAPNLEIESAHATGKTVVLTSDAESLAVYGNDLLYDSAKKLTVLKGEPRTIAMKDGNEIYAKELWLGTADRPEGHQATAIGPGDVSMLEKTPEGVVRTLKAHWKDKLEYHKEGSYDCLVLTGDASFEDEKQNQRMRADRLKVWLAPRNPETKETKEADGPRQVRPHHLEAKGHVVAESEDLHIKEPTDFLVIWFQDLPAKVDLLPPGTEQPAGVVQQPTPSQDPLAKQQAQPEKKRNKLVLSARAVEVNVLRAGNKHELERLWCEGTVHVRQDPDVPGDKGTDIRGDTLQLNHSADGGILVVTGKPAAGSLARVQFNKMSIIGAEVKIDQPGNRAWVFGEGAMTMLSDTNFDGVKLPQPTEMTINWKDKMEFDGLGADFVGAIQVTQENSRLLCQNMRVTFDRPVSLKTGSKGGPSPKVDKLLCDKDVFIEEETRQGAKVVGYRRLAAPVVDLDNANKTADISGPGVVRIFQLGTPDDFQLQPSVQRPSAKPTPAGTNSAKKPEHTITHVRFNDRMQAKQRESRIVKFWGDVHVVHVPSDQHDLEIDLDKLPPGCLYMHCNQLEVLSQRQANGKSSQEMIAKGNVDVRGNEFRALAETVKYDEAQDRIIFQGGDDGLAKFYHTKAQGESPGMITGKTITYWRKLDKVIADGVKGLQSK